MVHITWRFVSIFFPRTDPTYLIPDFRFSLFSLFSRSSWAACIMITRIKVWIVLYLYCTFWIHSLIKFKLGHVIKTFGHFWPAWKFWQGINTILSLYSTQLRTRFRKYFIQNWPRLTSLLKRIIWSLWYTAYHMLHNHASSKSAFEHNSNLIQKLYLEWLDWNHVRFVNILYLDTAVTV